jgi:hypothetical protein
MQSGYCDIETSSGLSIITVTIVSAHNMATKVDDSIDVLLRIPVRFAERRGVCLLYIRIPIYGRHSYQ